MRRPGETLLHIATVCAVFSSYFALSTTESLGIEVLLVPAVIYLLYPVGEFLDRRLGRLYRLAMNALTLVFIGSTPYWAFRIGLLDGVLVLVMYIQAFKFMHVKESKDYHQIYLMSFFIVLAACVMSPEAAVGAALGAFVLSAASGFAALEIGARASESHPLPVMEVLTGDEALNGSARATGPRLALPVLAASMLVLLMTVGLFLVTPRMEAGLFGRGRDRMPASTGLSDRVDLSDGGQIVPDPAPVMRVEVTGGVDNRIPEDELYWRATSLDVYSNGQWDRHNEPLRIVDTVAHGREWSLDRNELRRIVPAAFAPDTQVRQVIYLDETGEEGLPCLEYVQAVTSHGTQLAWHRRQDGTVLARSQRGGGVQYEAQSILPKHVPDDLRTAPYTYERVFPRQQLRMLTYHDLLPGTVALVNEVLEGQETVYDKALAIERWLSGDQFLYSLNVPRLGPRNAIDTFLTRVRTGHCELFATAMALMLRSQGVPARVVAGYRGGEWHERDSSYIVRKSMAHLWVEAYFINHGWVRFDPSPPSSMVPGNEVGRWARTASALILNLKMHWYRDVIGYSGRLQWARLGEGLKGFLGFGADGESASAGKSTSTRWNPGPGLIRALLTFVALFVLVFFVKGALRRTRDVLSPDQRRARELFHELRRTAGRRWKIPSAGLTAGELSEALAEHPSLPLDDIGDVLKAYLDARFGGRPMPRPEFAQLRRKLRALAHAAAD